MPRKESTAAATKGTAYRFSLGLSPGVMKRLKLDYDTLSADSKEQLERAVTAWKTREATCIAPSEWACRVWG